MFSFFKSQIGHEQEMEADRVGKELFRQISIFTDKCRSGEFTEDIFEDRANHTYTAAYMHGFISEKFFTLFDSDVERAKYTKRIMDGIFPKRGVLLIKAKLEKRGFYERLDSTGNETVEEYIHDYDIGYENGQAELIEWDRNPSYVPHLLSDFLITGTTTLSMMEPTMVSFNCEHCKASLRISKELQGKTLRCPACKGLNKLLE